MSCDKQVNNSAKIYTNQVNYNTWKFLYFCQKFAFFPIVRRPSFSMASSVRTVGDSSNSTVNFLIFKVFCNLFVKGIKCPIFNLFNLFNSPLYILFRVCENLPHLNFRKIQRISTTKSPPNESQIYIQFETRLIAHDNNRFSASVQAPWRESWSPTHIT